MRKLWLFSLFLTASSVFGQLDSDTVTIQASRLVNPTPDQFVFYLSVSASPSTTLDRVVAALSPTGITASDFDSMYGGADSQSSLQWSFTLAVPFTKTTSTIASLIALEQSIGQNDSGMSLMFQGTHVSSQAIQWQSCAAKDLVADAQAQAQNLAAAAGLALGPILAISDGSSGRPAGTYVANAWFSVSSFLLGYTTTPSGCYLEVKFKLLRY